MMINSFQEFKRDVFAVIDKLTSEMNGRFSDRNKKTVRGIDALTPTSENFLNQDIIAEFAREYSSMVTGDFLPAEINNFRQMLKRRKESESANWQGPETLLKLQGYVHRLRDAFTEMDKLYFAHFYSFLRTKFYHREVEPKNQHGERQTGRSDDSEIHRARAAKIHLDDVV